MYIFKSLHGGIRIIIWLRKRQCLLPHNSLSFVARKNMSGVWPCICFNAIHPPVITLCFRSMLYMHGTTNTLDIDCWNIPKPLIVRMETSQALSYLHITSFSPACVDLSGRRAVPVPVWPTSLWNLKAGISLNRFFRKRLIVIPSSFSVEKILGIKSAKSY